MNTEEKEKKEQEIFMVSRRHMRDLIDLTEHLSLMNESAANGGAIFRSAVLSVRADIIAKLNQVFDCLTRVDDLRREGGSGKE